MSHAITQSRMLIVEALIRYGASPYEIDDKGDTPVEHVRQDRRAASHMEDAIQMFEARPRCRNYVDRRRGSDPAGKRQRVVVSVWARPL